MTTKSSGTTIGKRRIGNISKKTNENKKENSLIFIVRDLKHFLICIYL